MEPADPMLSIGVFARRSRLSMKALRLYDRLGLLPPADVDPRSGYRRYRQSQLVTARLIVLLRRLDMPLAEIREVAAAAPERAAELVATYWQAVERRTAARRELAAHIARRLAGDQAEFPQLAVRERDVAEQLVLTEQRHLLIDELEHWMDAATRRLQHSAHRLGTPPGRLFRVFHGEVDEDSDGPVEICLPIGLTADPPGDIATRCEPAHREVYVRVNGAQYEYPQILSAYQVVENWIASKGLCCAGPPREIPLHGVDLARAAPTEAVCDVAYPVR